jgi:predicted MFS family arabinose efflux permease
MAVLFTGLTVADIVGVPLTTVPGQHSSCLCRNHGGPPA